MNLINAINILGIKGAKIEIEDVKKAYREASKKYHPDINPAGEHMMKMVNEAKETLFEKTFPINVDQENEIVNNYGEEVNEALNKIINLPDIVIEVCGAWIWVSGETKKHWPLMKEAGFWLATKKKVVYFRPEKMKGKGRSAPISMEEIRSKYGSNRIRSKGPKALESTKNNRA